MTDFLEPTRGARAAHAADGCPGRFGPRLIFPAPRAGPWRRPGAPWILASACALALAVGLPTGATEDEPPPSPSLDEEWDGQEQESPLPAPGPLLQALENYMTGLRAVNRWQEAVEPVSGRGASFHRRQEAGGLWAREFAQAEWKWREAQAVLEQAAAAKDFRAALHGTLVQAIRQALEALGELRLVAQGLGREVDPPFYRKAVSKLCLANERVLHVLTYYRLLIQRHPPDSQEAELLTLRGPGLDLTATYLKSRGCR